MCIRALIPEPNSAPNRAGCRKASQGDIIHSSYNSRVSISKQVFLLSPNFHAATASVSTMAAFNEAADRVVFHDGPILSPCSPGWGLGMYKMLSSDDAHSRTLSSFHF